MRRPSGSGEGRAATPGARSSERDGPLDGKPPWSPGLSRAVLLLALGGFTLSALWVQNGVRWHVVALLGALLAFGGLLVLEWSRPRLRLGLVLAASAVLLSIAVSAPPRESQDVWAYAMYGRILVVHHANPYVRPPEAFPTDPYFPRVFSAWQERPALYGPLFTAIAGSVVKLSGSSPTSVRLGFQFLAALAVLGCLVLVSKRTSDPLAVAFLGLNPLITIDVVNGAHNDILVGLCVLAAVLLVEKRRAVPAGLVLAAAVLIKVPALLPAAALALWAWRRHGWRSAATVALLTATVGVAAYLAVGRSSLTTLHGASTLVSPYSIWSLPRTLHVLELGRARRYLPPVSQPLLAAALPFTIALGGFLALAQLRRSTPVLAVTGAVIAYFLAATYVAPWYIAWALPAVALEWRRPMAWVAEACATALLITYLVLGAAFQASGRIDLANRKGTAAFLIADCLAILVVASMAVRDLAGRRFGLAALPDPAMGCVGKGAGEGGQ